MYNKNGCGNGRGLSIGVWHVGVVIMVPETISKKLRPMPSSLSLFNFLAKILHPLPQITSQIESRGGDRASVILMLTDGILLDPSSILETAVRDAHEGLGARIFVIGIGESVSRDQVRGISCNGDLDVGLDAAN